MDKDKIIDHLTIKRNALELACRDKDDQLRHLTLALNEKERQVEALMKRLEEQRLEEEREHLLQRLADAQRRPRRPAYTDEPNVDDLWRAATERRIRGEE